MSSHLGLGLSTPLHLQTASHLHEQAARRCLGHNRDWNRAALQNRPSALRNPRGLTIRLSELTPASARSKAPVSASAVRIGKEANTASRGVTVKASPGEASGGGTGRESDDDHEPEAFILLVAGCIGLATGAGVVVFNYAIHEIQNIAWGNVLLSQGGGWARTMEPRQPGLWKLIIAPPAIGGLIVAALQLTFGEFKFKAKPKPGIQEAVRSAEPLVGAQRLLPADASMAVVPSGGPLQVSEWLQSAKGAWERMSISTRPITKTAAAAVTLGTGASLGPEGPSVEIGKAFAETFGSALRSRRRHITSLLAAGSAAGVAAGFNAPIAGVFFAVETVLRRQQAALAEEDDSSGITIAAVLLASVLAAVVSQAGLGSAPAFRIPDYMEATPGELPLFMVLGLLCGATSALSTYSTKLSVAGFDWLRAVGVPGALLPVVGGTLTGCFAVFYPEILYQGFNNVNTILKGGFAYEESLLLQILAVKIVVTSVCRGSGLVGGIYAPSIFQGAALGSLFGCIVSKLVTPLGLEIAQTPVYALVGVAGILAANCRVPLTSVLLLFELTRDYALILPTLLAVGLSFWAVQFCLRALAALAAYTPDDSEQRGDEAPPFAVTRETPFLSLGSVLASADEADSTLKSAAGQLLDDTQASDRQQEVPQQLDAVSATEASSNGAESGLRSDRSSSSSSSSPTSSSNSSGTGDASSPASTIQTSAPADGTGGIGPSPAVSTSLLPPPPPSIGATATAAALPAIEQSPSKSNGLPAAALSWGAPQAALNDSSASSVSVQCAAEDSCLVFFDNTTAAEALAAFDSTGRSVGVIQGDDGQPIGVVTRESVVRALETS